VPGVQGETETATSSVAHVDPNATSGPGHAERSFVQPAGIWTEQWQGGVPVGSSERALNDAAADIVHNFRLLTRVAGAVASVDRILEAAGESHRPCGSVTSDRPRSCAHRPTVSKERHGRALAPARG